MQHQQPTKPSTIALLSGIVFGLASCHIAVLLGNRYGLSFQGKELDAGDRFSINVVLSGLCIMVLVLSLVITPLIVRFANRYSTKPRIVWLLRILGVVMALTLHPIVFPWGSTILTFVVFLTWLGIHGLIATLIDRASHKIP